MGYHQAWTADEPFVRDLEAAHKICVPNRDCLKQLGWEERQRRVRGLYEESIAFIGDCSSATMAFLVCMRGLHNALLDLIGNPSLVHAVMEKGAAIAVEKGKLNIASAA